MSRLSQISIRLTALALMLAVAGCGLTKSDTIEVACPPLGALKQADELTRFKAGPGRDLTDVIYAVKVGRIAGKCEVKQSVELATIIVGVELLGERGPAIEDPRPEIEYFIAMQAPNGEIAARQAFTLPIDFEGGVLASRSLDYLTFKIPGASPAALRAYRVYVGLQLTREEYEFSERARARAR